MSMIHMGGRSGVGSVMSLEVVGLMTMVFRMMVVGAERREMTSQREREKEKGEREREKELIWM